MPLSASGRGLGRGQPPRQFANSILEIAATRTLACLRRLAFSPRRRTRVCIAPNFQPAGNLLSSGCSPRAIAIGYKRGACQLCKPALRAATLTSPNPFSQRWEKGNWKFCPPLPSLGEGLGVRALGLICKADMLPTKGVMGNFLPITNYPLLITNIRNDGRQLAKAQSYEA